MKTPAHLLAALLALSAPGLAQENEIEPLEDLAAVRALAERAAKTIQEGRVRDALDLLRPYWPVPKQDIDKVAAQFEGQRPGLENRYGKLLGMEFAGTQTIGSSFRRYLFLEKYERHGLLWVFSFYRPKEDWIVSTVFYTGQLEDHYQWD